MRRIHRCSAHAHPIPQDVVLLDEGPYKKSAGSFSFDDEKFSHVGIYLFSHTSCVYLITFMEPSPVDRKETYLHL